MKRVVIGLLSSRRNSVRQDWIRASWGKKSDVVFYSDHRDPTRNVVKVSDQTHYRSNEEKHINFLNQVGIKLADQYEWIFCADDDSFINVANLHAWIDQLSDRDQIYANLITYANAPTNPIYENQKQSLVYPAGGAGYLIPSQVIRKVFPFTNYHTGFSDVSFGLNMARCHIPQIDCRDRLFSQPPKFYKHGESEMRAAVSYHYIKTKENVSQLCAVADIPCPALSDRPALKGFFWRHWH